MAGIKRKVPPKPPAGGAGSATSPPQAATNGAGSAASKSAPTSSAKSNKASTPSPGKKSPSPTASTPSKGGPAFAALSKPILKACPPRLICMGYGAPGTVKTPALTALPKEMWPVLFINIDAGGENMDSVFERHKVLPTVVDESGLPVGPPSAEDPWNMVALTAPVDGNMWDWLVGVLTWPDWETRLGIRSVVFDGFSTLGKYLLTMSAQTQQFTSAKARETGGGTPNIGDREKFYQPSPGDYGLAQNALSNVRAMMTARQWNVIAAAHQTLRVQEVDGASTTLAGPSLPGTASMQDFGAEWSQFLRFFLGKPKVVNGVSHTMARVQLAHQGYWPARVRKGPEILDKPSWLLQYDHPELWRFIARETGVEFRHGEPLECYAEMPEGSTRGDAVERDEDGTIKNLKEIGLA